MFASSSASRLLLRKDIELLIEFGERNWTLMVWVAGNFRLKSWNCQHCENFLTIRALRTPSMRKLSSYTLIQATRNFGLNRPSLRTLGAAGPWPLGTLPLAAIIIPFSDIILAFTHKSSSS